MLTLFIVPSESGFVSSKTINSFNSKDEELVKKAVIIDSFEDINENYLTELLILIQEKKITDLVGKEILEEMINKNTSPLNLIKKKSLEKISDEDKIKKLCEEVIKDNQQAVQDFKQGNEKALFFLTGKVMYKLKKAGDPKIINKILKELLS